MLRGILVLLVASIVLVLTACGPERCPTYGDFGVGSELEMKISNAVSSKLNNPSSYQPEIYLSGLTKRSRPDSDEEYYDAVIVEFTAENVYGGRVKGKATVTLRDYSDDGCVVIATRLWR